MKFIKQDKPTNCAPVAAYNALQWLGFSGDLEYLEYLMGYKPDNKKGIYGDSIQTALESLQIDYEFNLIPYKSIFWEDLKHTLSENTAVYLGYLNKNNPKKKRNTLKHAVFLFTRNGKYYIVNDKKWTQPKVLLEVDAQHLKALTQSGASGYFIRRNNDFFRKHQV